MRLRSSIALLCPILVACAAAGATREPRVAADSSPAAAQGRSTPLEKRTGLLDLWVDEDEGRVWLELPEASREGQSELGRFIYVEGLTGGLGSNPVGLDRGELGRTRVVSLVRAGSRVLVIEPNLRYRADSGSADERIAVERSFATSVIWSGAIDRETIEGAWLVDLTTFLIRDAHDVAGRLEAAEQGTFSLDAERSVVDLQACLAFPDNLELEALVTFTGEKPGPLVVETAPTAQSVTLVQHHSLIRLPDDGYRPRAFDPRAGSIELRFADYAAALDDSIERRWIVRHRLHRQDPAASASPPVEPIVYYVDPAIPEPVRGAVLDGVGWWAEALSAAGFEDAFRAELLPAEAHPLDVRYNVVQWVHRSTRGWSYGGGIVDPRTGERLKGHVRLGSLRVRQDRLLFEGLAGTERTGTGGPDDPVELALARIRQLAAHEVGHALGLAHNFAASTYGGRASVMDYPAPLVRVTEDGELDFSAAYGVGVGEWDLQAIRYAYSDFGPDADEAAALEEVVRSGLDRGLVFLSDDDARPPGAAQPLASLWDNGADPVAQLGIEMEVRRLALERFGERNVRPGTPLALLEEVLAPVYLHHRYQLAAAAKVLGGVDYRHSLRGDGQPPARPLPAAEQRRALGAILETLEPAALDLPDAVLELLLPRPAGHERSRELLESSTLPLFDPLSAAAAAADLALQALLQPERAARMVDFHRRDAALPDLSEVLTAVVDTAFDAPPESERRRAVRQRVQAVVVARLISLAGDAGASPEVRARADQALDGLALRLADPGAAAAPTNGGLGRHLHRAIRRHLDRPGVPVEAPVAAPEAPPGDPIGGFRSTAARAGCSW